MSTGETITEKSKQATKSAQEERRYDRNAKRSGFDQYDNASNESPPPSYRDLCTARLRATARAAAAESAAEPRSAHVYTLRAKTNHAIANHDVGRERQVPGRRLVAQTRHAHEPRADEQQALLFLFHALILAKVAHRTVRRTLGIGIAHLFPFCVLTLF